MDETNKDSWEIPGHALHMSHLGHNAAIWREGQLIKWVIHNDGSGQRLLGVHTPAGETTVLMDSNTGGMRTVPLFIELMAKVTMHLQEEISREHSRHLMTKAGAL